MIPLIETDRVTRDFETGHRFGTAKRTVRGVDSVSLTIHPGVSVGIVGESGCGKSTLARLMTLLIRPTSGHVRFKGESTETLTGEKRLRFRRSVQMIFQDPASSLNPRQRIIDILSEPFIIHRLADRRQIPDRVVTLAGQVGLSEQDLFRYPHGFSGGQRQRIGIARALATDPELLVADEPLSALDLSIQAQIINLLNELKRDRHLTLVVISHDLSAMPHLVETVAVMYRGMIVETGPGTVILHSPRHPYTRSLLDAVPTIEPLPGHPPRSLTTGVDLPPPEKGCPFAPRCPGRRPRCCGERPPLTETGGGHQIACHYPLPR